mmetsp:Transcript_2732/g.7476  ORF Transcript_2732/g.7476 Transcript_2732/m.7476 type:complete len:106 (-) Transcript_2732:1035-1352(-)
MEAFVGSSVKVGATSTFGAPLVCAAAPKKGAVAAPVVTMVTVQVNDGEPVESALRRFKRAVMASGHLQEIRNRRYFEPPSVTKQRVNASHKRRREINKLLRNIED